MRHQVVRPAAPVGEGWETPGGLRRAPTVAATLLPVRDSLRWRAAAAAPARTRAALDWLRQLSVKGAGQSESGGGGPAAGPAKRAGPGSAGLGFARFGSARLGSVRLGSAGLGCRPRAGECPLPTGSGLLPAPPREFPEPGSEVFFPGCLSNARCTLGRLQTALSHIIKKYKMLSAV